MKIDAAEFAAWNASAKTCNASVLPKPKLSFAFQGKSRFGGNEGEKTVSLSDRESDLNLAREEEEPAQKCVFCSAGMPR